SHDLAQAVVVGKRADVPLIAFPSHTVHILRGHSDSVYSAVFTHDGRTMLTASDDSTARIWNLANGSSQVLRGHDDDAYRIHLSSDEKLAVTASLDGSLRVWPLENSDAKVMLEGPPIQWLSVEGDKALVRTATSLARWDLVTGAREPLLSWQQGLGVGTPSPDGQRLIALGPKWTLELRSRDGKPPLVLAGHRGVISHVEWNRDGSAAYSSSYDGTLRKWDLATGKSTLLVDGDVPVPGFAVAADERIAAQLGDDSMIMISRDGHAESLGTGPAYCSRKAQFDKVSDRLLIQRCDKGFEIYDGSQLVALPTDGNAIERIAVSPDGERIAGAISDRTIRIWDVHGALVKVLRGHSDLVLDVAFSPDGTELASASYDNTVRIWEIATKRHRVIRGHAAAVTSVVWRGQDHLVTASFDGTIRVWPVPKTDPPTQDEVYRRLENATSAQIDAQNRATTVGG
ncbi:MAG TPA: WD40 repeat domain-containing protein, partial [Kofleriaceae bacterium]|nr:WD40 repeat domain-containing protein [Kofleriaceae bacterium]